jgi:hypothetical protein
MLVCDYISGATGSFSTAFGAHTGIGTANYFVWFGRTKTKNMFLNLLQVSGLVRIV